MFAVAAGVSIQEKYDEQFLKLFTHTMQQLKQVYCDCEISSTVSCAVAACCLYVLCMQFLGAFQQAHAAVRLRGLSSSLGRCEYRLS